MGSAFKESQANQVVTFETTIGAACDVLDPRFQALAGPAGIMIDDVFFAGAMCSPVESASWGRIKAIYR